MKKLLSLFTGLFVVTAVAITAQTGVSFQYDADGNMTSRTVVLPPPTRATDNGVPEKEPEVYSDQEGAQTITIYPNPTRGEVKVDISPLNPEVENLFLLYNSAGQMIENRRIEGESTVIEINGNPGVYLLNLRLGTTISQWKIIKQ